MLMPGEDFALQESTYKWSIGSKAVNYGLPQKGSSTELSQR